jgi:serine protease Do
LLASRIGNSNDVEIGDFVLAVGSPFGLSHSVSYGIVSAKGRWDLALGQGTVRFQDFFQTDAAINPGNSGGPLLNLRGEVIGINTAIASNSGGNEGIGFSIPIILAVNVARQLIEDGAVATAYLGVRLDDRFAEKLAQDTNMAKRLGLPRVQGAFVKAVTPGSPAAEARLQPGDVVMEFNGHRVEDDDHLINLVSLTPLNEVVSLNIVRQRKTYLVHVRVGRRRDFEFAEQARR